MAPQTRSCITPCPRIRREACAFAKQTRLPYRQYERKSPKATLARPFGYDSIQTLSIDGKLYFMAFIDDFSPYCWVYFTTRKDAKTIHDVYIHRKADAENEAGTSVAYLQTAAVNTKRNGGNP